MKLIFLASLFVSGYAEIKSNIRTGLALPPESESLANYQTYYLPQYLDHFSSNPTKWNQRYFVNDQYWGGGNSPIFLMVGGEGEASPVWMNSGSWVRWAAKYKALLYLLEHRFYGQSHPTTDTSTENLKYLKSQQALADVANFIYQVNTANNFTANKWILFGGSYPGNLVAWARLKYPHYVFGSISSSGPLQAEGNFYQYNDVVRDSLNSLSSGCADQLTAAVKKIDQMFRTQAGMNSLSSKFTICGGFNPNKAYDRATFIEQMTNPIASAVQYNNQKKDLSINIVCRYMNNRSVADPVDRLAQFHRYLNTSCIYGSYDGIVNYYKGTNWNDDNVAEGGRQWFYQTCNEFGYYQTSDKNSSLLGNTIPYGFFTQQCTDVFGANFNAQQLSNSIDYTNRYYGGTNIQVQRVVFLQGSIDPWHALGIVQQPTNQDPLLYIQGTSHCYDMLSPQLNDPPSLTSARNTVDQYLNYWMQL